MNIVSIILPELIGLACIACAALNIDLFFNSRFIRSIDSLFGRTPARVALGIMGIAIMAGPLLTP